MVVERVVEWLPKVWQRVNRFLESHSNFDITIGIVVVYTRNNNRMQDTEVAF